MFIVIVIDDTVVFVVIINYILIVIDVVVVIVVNVVRIVVNRGCSETTSIYEWYCTFILMYLYLWMNGFDPIISHVIIIKYNYILFNKCRY